MPKVSILQPSFSGGEFSPKFYGRTDVERYKTALARCLNYVPTVQGPLIRRPGFKYAGEVKDPSKPPRLIPFQFSQKQTYVIEAGDKYFRFWSNEGQILSSSSPYEVVSPYAYDQIFNLQFCQKDDTVFIAHGSTELQSLIRYADDDWQISEYLLRDGPYRTTNTLNTFADAIDASFVVDPAFKKTPTSRVQSFFNIGPVYAINGYANSGGLTRVYFPVEHGYTTADKIAIYGNDASFSSALSTTYGDLRGGSSRYDVVSVASTSVVINLNWPGGVGYSGSGHYSTLAIMTDTRDWGHVVGVSSGGQRYWGDPEGFIYEAGRALVRWYTFPQNNSGFSGATWQLGLYRASSNPTSVTFHQDRLVLDGGAYHPQVVALSQSGIYNDFAPSGSSYVVTDANGITATLTSQERNDVSWLASHAQGLLVGTINSEFDVSPSNDAGALTPTSVSARESGFFGSDNVQPVRVNNAILYVQRNGTRLREQNYFYQVAGFRSTDLTELADHLTIQGIKQLAVQRDQYPALWACRDDGGLVSMSYNRDDETLKAGWAEHVLGGRSDASGSAPKVKSLAIISGSNASYDQMWIATQRYINGTSVCYVEYSMPYFDDSKSVTDAFYLDAGGAFDNPKAISLITRGSATVITATSHGFSNGDTVRISEVIGLNKNTPDINGIDSFTNLVNSTTFLVASSAANDFKITDFDGNDVDSGSYDSYVSGGFARKLVSSISGFTWLKNETVNILADGRIHGTTVVNSAGVVSLTFPAAKVQVGLPYASKGQTLRADAGSGDGTAIGKLRRPYYAGFMLHNVGEFSVGTDFARMTPLEFFEADQNKADQPINLFTGIKRESLESEFDFEGQICWQQDEPLPGIVQSVMTVYEENDV